MLLVERGSAGERRRRRRRRRFTFVEDRRAEVEGRLRGCSAQSQRVARGLREFLVVVLVLVDGGEQARQPLVLPRPRPRARGRWRRRRRRRRRRTAAAAAAAAARSLLLSKPDAATAGAVCASVQGIQAGEEVAPAAEGRDAGADREGVGSGSGRSGRRSRRGGGGGQTRRRRRRRRRRQRRRRR